MLSKLDAGWFETPLGQHLLFREQRYFDQAVSDVFGFNAVQVGLPHIDFLRNSRIPLRVSCAVEAPAQVNADPMFLPFENQSLDLLLLPHVLEFSSNPHQVLREAERVLRPEGRLVLAGFNPRSLWGLAHQLKGSERGYPWNGRRATAGGRWAVACIFCRRSNACRACMSSCRSGKHPWHPVYWHPQLK
ncbi:MAG: methyl-transferase [Proteobacteria bacterium]|nr:methyl-transferase [Pseudomonadota bacterium]